MGVNESYGVAGKVTLGETIGAFFKKGFDTECTEEEHGEHRVEKEAVLKANYAAASLRSSLRA